MHLLRWSRYFTATVACTKDSLFRGPDDKLYAQKNDVYMTHVEEATFSDSELKPTTNCRYVDDIFLEVRDGEHLIPINRQLETNSVLSFTYERQQGNCLSFLHVSVQATPNKYVTSV